MKTVNQILIEIHRHKTCSIPQLYRYFKACGVKPLGARQRPRLYPDETAQVVLTHLGFSTELQSQPAIVTSSPDRIVSMAELRAERSKARKSRRAA